MARLARGPGGPDRDETIARLHERAAGQLQALVTDDDWARWLRLAARFPGWSFTNTLLVAAQRPDATLLAGYDEWHAQGRQVLRGEPGILIFADGNQHGDKVGRPKSRPAGASTAEQQAGASRLTYVWDVSQTTGSPVQDERGPFPPGKLVLPGLWDALTWLARRDGFAVDRVPAIGSDGAARWNSRRIAVDAALDEPAAVRTLLHELGHVLAHPNAIILSGTTGECRGSRKVEADSIGFIVATRLGLDTSAYSWPYVASWAGSDPRARPEEAIRAAGNRITHAAAVILSHLDAALFGKPSPHQAPVQDEERQPGKRTRHDGERADATPRLPGTVAAPQAEVGGALTEAERFYCGQLAGSWAPGYLAARGVGPDVARPWRVGYAPGGWTVLTSHLRRLGFSDPVIEAAGLARRSRRGTLIDHFRDRLMLAVRDEQGRVAGFIGRAPPDAQSSVPRYLNSPETSSYRKGDLLFGLHEARDLLRQGAVPVIVEGPFDAIAVTTAASGRFAGLAPCGTALTDRQTAALARAADLGQTGVLVALDGDRAGHEGAVRAYDVLLAHTGKLSAAIMPPGRDPAEILQTVGPAALMDAFEQSRPLAQVAIDAYLHHWGRQLDYAEGQLAAMRGAAALIASTLPGEVADVIREVTGGRRLVTLDENLQSVVNSELTQIAKLLPATVVCQILRVAERTGQDHSDVTTELVNAVGQTNQRPPAGTREEPRDDARQRPATRQGLVTPSMGERADDVRAVGSWQSEPPYVPHSRPALQHGRSHRTRR